MGVERFAVTILSHFVESQSETSSSQIEEAVSVVDSCDIGCPVVS